MGLLKSSKWAEPGYKYMISAFHIDPYLHGVPRPHIFTQAEQLALNSYSVWTHLRP